MQKSKFLVFSDYYTKLSVEKKKEFRELVIEETGMSLPTFYYKMRNKNWRKSEISIISNIINNFSNA